MTKAKLKTAETKNSPLVFINSVKDEQQKQDCLKLLKIFETASKEPAKMWGKSIVGFGTAHLKYASGRELDWMMVGFSPRKGYLSLYLNGGFEGYEKMVKALGNLTKTTGCLNVKKLSDIDEKKLKELIVATVKNGHRKNL